MLTPRTFRFFWKNTKETENECEKCGKKFIDKTQLEEHVRDDHNSVKCTACDKKFVDKSHLENHVHSQETSENECEKCKKRFADKTQLEEHVRDEHRKIKCTECEKQFKTECQLEDHNRDEHYKIQVKLQPPQLSLKPPMLNLKPPLTSEGPQKKRKYIRVKPSVPKMRKITTMFNRVSPPNTAQTKDSTQDRNARAKSTGCSECDKVAGEKCGSQSRDCTCVRQGRSSLPPDNPSRLTFTQDLPGLPDLAQKPTKTKDFSNISDLVDYQTDSEEIIEMPGDDK